MALFKRDCAGARQVAKIVGGFEKMIGKLNTAIASIDGRIDDNNVEITSLTDENNSLLAERARATHTINSINALISQPTDIHDEIEERR